VTKKSDYKGKAPVTIFVVATQEGFRTYVYEKQAINWLEKNLKQGKRAKILTYVQEPGV
jgi:translation elongation factor P/translation initiation factor 5A